MNISRNFIVIGMVYVLIGMLIGAHMAASGNHAAGGAHAHINLIGFVMMVLFGLCYRVFPDLADNGLARLHFWLHQVGALVFLAAYLRLRETNRSLQPDASIIRTTLYATLLRNPAFRGYAATVAFGSAVFFCYLAVAPFIMVTVHGFSPVEYGTWFMCSAMGYMAGNFISGRYSVQVGNDSMIRIGNLLTLAGAIVMLAFALSGHFHPSMLFLPMAVCAFGNGIMIPNALSAAISVDPKNIGSGAGLTGFLQIALGALASQAVGYFQDTWINVGFWVMIFMAVLAALAHWYNPRQ